MKKKKEKKESYITEKQIINKYGFTKGMIDKYLGEPTFSDSYYNGYRRVKLKKYKESDVLNLLKVKEIKNKIDKRIKKKEDALRKRKEKEAKFKSYLESFDIDGYTKKAKSMDRYFILHVGPTNSGKTYEAIERLKKASSGVYLGPLRLLALEMYDKLNESGVRCELLTGEEHIKVEDSIITSSTIELLDVNKEYEVAVIDEAQLINDKYRGDRWTKAIYSVNAKEVHICLAPEALNIITKILDSFDSLYKIVNHERLAPLKFMGSFKDISKVERGDAIIVFSRKACLNVSAYLQTKGIKSSVIYGALPPESRKEEVRKFKDNETSVVVSTDAIGMGVSLPIKRIIFKEITKFDGETDRLLTESEIKQIAGRAGRYGIYDIGYCLSMEDYKYVEVALENKIDDIEFITLPFPNELIDSEYDFKDLFEGWNNLKEVDGIKRADMSEALFLYNLLKDIRKFFDRRELYKLITIPFDIKNGDLLKYYLECVTTLLTDKDVYEPIFSCNKLEDYELLYKAYDLYHNFKRQLDLTDNISLIKKKEISDSINEILKKSKKNYIKKCRICGRELDIIFKYNICDSCHYLRKDDYYFD